VARKELNAEQKDLFDMLTNTEQFSSGGYDDLLKKTFDKSEESTFRLRGHGRKLYVHQFKAKDGILVRSICTKDKEGNGGDDCPLCQKHQRAWDIIKEDKEAQDKGKKSPHDAKKLKAAKLFTGQEKDPKTGYPANCGARKMILWNVIDRDSDINKNENHCSVLCKSEYDLGISAGWNGIYEKIVYRINRNQSEFREHLLSGGDGAPFDITVVKKEEGKGKKKKTSYHAEKDNSSVLTDEEMGYELYDLEKLTKPTSLKLIEKWLTKGVGKQDDDDKDKTDDDKTTSRRGSSSKKDKPSGDDDGDTKTNDDSDTGTDDGGSDDENKDEDGQSTESNEEKPSGDDDGDTGTDDGGSNDENKDEDGQSTESNDEDGDGVETDNCPECGKKIQVTLEKCPHCGEELEYEDENSDGDGDGDEATPF